MLDEREKIIVELRDNEQKTFKEISEKLGVTPARISCLYRRAHRKIEFASKYPDDPKKIEFERYIGKHLNGKCFNTLKRYDINSYEDILYLSDADIEHIAKSSSDIFESLITFRNKLQDLLGIEKESNNRIDADDLHDEIDKFLSIVNSHVHEIHKLPYFNSSSNYKITSKIEHELNIPSDQCLEMINTLKANGLDVKLNYNPKTNNMIISTNITVVGCGD